jgi:hypothetical protein
MTIKQVMQMRYLTRVPRAPLENGRVLVHNHVRHTKYARSGTRGFRYWSQKLTSDLEHAIADGKTLPTIEFAF